MKINKTPAIQEKSTSFKALSGKLPKELNKFQNEFMEYAQKFMAERLGYDVFVSVSKNNLKMKGQAGFSYLEKATTKKPVSEIKSVENLKEMLNENYSIIYAGKNILQEMSTIGKLFPLL